MDISKFLILLKGEDKTANVSFVKRQGGLTRVTFNNNKSFNYRSPDVVFQQAQGLLDWTGKVIHINHSPVDNVDKLVDFGAYIRVIYTTGRQQLCPRNAITLAANALQKPATEQLFAYFKRLAAQLGLANENGESILAREYTHISTIPEGSILASYLQAPHSVATRSRPSRLFYPFGINASQKQAVENAFGAQISIIQGPPGTGKTQTILNIIANALIQHKTVAVVSNNNSATQNVVEKLAKQQLAFMAAFLGKSDNKQDFVEKQTGTYPSMEGWLLPKDVLLQLEARTEQLNQELGKNLELQNRQAELQQEIMALQTEAQHFSQYKEQSLEAAYGQVLSKLSSEQLLEIWLLCEQRLQEGGRLSLWSEIKLWFKYNGAVVRLLEQASAATIVALQQGFYLKREGELQSQVKSMADGLSSIQLEEKITELTELSLQRLRHALAQRYRGRNSRPVFSSQQLRYNSAAFLEEYPLLLSTTYSLKNCLAPQQQYDYVIVDEASQVDLLTGVLTLSCAQNIIIVGDLQQLPNVVTREEARQVALAGGLQVEPCYNFAQQSLLSSAVAVWRQAPSVLLREHYRCQPKIIEFCNQKFYNGQLLVMTKEEQELPPLRLYKTPVGNHARKYSNQREVDVISKEVLPSLMAAGLKEVGVIAPYRDQVQLLRSQLPSLCEIDTVHKFQGREKDVIILSSVDNQLTDFVDDAHMLNVAVSRAVKALIVVTTGNEQGLSRNYTALARYIAYQNGVVVNSRIHSVFDLLYKGYARQRKRFLKQHQQVSSFASENLLYAIVEELLQQEEFKDLDCACHVPLRMLFRDISMLSEEEQAFAQHPLSHTDFLIYSKVDKTPLLAIEVDGVSFHAPGSRQAARDAKKDHIFALEGLSLLRLRTDGSGEKEAITQLLRQLKQA